MDGRVVEAGLCTQTPQRWQGDDQARRPAQVRLNQSSRQQELRTRPVAETDWIHDKLVVHG